MLNVSLENSSTSGWCSCRPRTVCLYPGQKISRRYRLARIRRREYRRLKQIVPSIAGRTSVSKVEVIEEAISYIDHLHAELAQRFLVIQDIQQRSVSRQQGQEQAQNGRLNFSSQHGSETQHAGSNLTDIGKQVLDRLYQTLQQASAPVLTISSPAIASASDNNCFLQQSCAPSNKDAVSSTTAGHDSSAGSVLRRRVKTSPPPLPRSSQSKRLTPPAPRIPLYALEMITNNLPSLYAKRIRPSAVQ